MKLRSLTLSNVRKFAGRTARISEIGDGVSVVSEANEFGKSTFFDALHALFFLKYGAATREVKSLQPRAGGAVRISAEIELPTGRFTLEKSFLAQKRASVRDASGSLVALDDEAEQWIAQLMENGLDGPAGLLWVRQGTTALEPAGSTGADKSEKERLLGARRDLLSSVAGEIDMVTGGRRMDRVIEAANTALGRLATATGQPKTGGPWKQAEIEAQDHAARHAELDRACTALSQALVDRREVAARLEMLENPKAQRTRAHALDAAQAAFVAAQAHADKQAQAHDQISLRQLEADHAQGRLDALIASEAAFAKATAQHATAKAEQTAATEQVARHDTAMQAAQAALTDATSSLAALVAAREAAQQGALRRNAVDTYHRLQAQLAMVMDKRAALDTAHAVLRSLPVTGVALAKIDAAALTLGRAQAQAAAEGVQITLSYTGAERAVIMGTKSEGGTGVETGINLAAGTHRVTQALQIDLPGLGRMRIDPGAAVVDMAAVEEAQTAFDHALGAVGAVTVEDARKGAARRVDVAADTAMLEGVLATLAPDGTAPMQQRVAQAQVARDALLETSRDMTAPAPDPAALASRIEAAQDVQDRARALYEQSRDARDAAHTSQARAQALLGAAQGAFDVAAGQYGDPDSFEQRKAEAARAHSLAQVAARDAQTAAQALTQAAPDLASAQADLSRAQSVSDNARDEAEQLRTRRADLSATIRARAEDGVEEKRDEATGQVHSARARAARFAHEAAGLTLLVAALRAKRGAAQEAYFGPVQQELAPLLALLHADAALSFDPASLLPQGLVRGGGVDETLETLSGGTQEQIAILTRLAFARLFAKQGKPMPVILDDALVYSDDTRIIAMFTALHRAAADQQVIVFSCRQMAFAGLGGARPKVQITQEA